VNRDKPLRANPEKVRAFQDRARDKAREKAYGRDGERSRSLRAKSEVVVENFGAPKPRRRRDRLPGARTFKRRVFGLYGSKCVVCGKRADQAHHGIPVNVILDDVRKPPDVRRAIANDARHGVPVCTPDHHAHEGASRRIRRWELPQGVIDWATEHGYEYRIEALYPVEAWT